MFQRKDLVHGGFKVALQAGQLHLVHQSAVALQLQRDLITAFLRGKVLVLPPAEAFVAIQLQRSLVVAHRDFFVFVGRKVFHLIHACSSGAF